MMRSGDAFADRSFPTALPDLQMRLLNAADTRLLHLLIAENSEHLTRHGDYRELVAMSRQDLETELSGEDAGHMRFGIFLKEALIGRMDLIGVAPRKCSIGYWLSENATGKGYGSGSLKALIDFARGELGVSALYAGVTHGNGRSSTLLKRVGFEPVAVFATYTRFHLDLGAV